MKHITIMGKTTFKTEEPKYKIPAIDKAMAILFYLKEERSATLSEIVSDLGLPKSTVYQLLSSLQHYGFIAKYERTNSYTLGLRLYEFAHCSYINTDIVEHAHPYLEKLRDRTGQTAQLAIQDGHKVIYIDKVVGSYGDVIRTWVGRHEDLYCTGSGKTLLAWQDENVLGDILNHIEFEQRTPYTVKTKTELLDQIPKIR